MLSVDSLHSYYGRSHILQGVTLQIENGQVLGILGRNGMGKTTLVRSILGLHPPEIRAGAVVLDGKELTHLPSPEISRQGIGLVPQGRRVFGSLTVSENLDIAEMAGRGREGVDWTRADVDDLFPVLGERPRQPAASLSGGEQAMLAIARALLTRPRLLVMDEPSEGLAPGLVKTLVERLRGLKERGMTILLVEQNLRVVRAMADRVLIMDRGMVVSSLHNHEFQARWDEVRASLGV